MQQRVPGVDQKQTEPLPEPLLVLDRQPGQIFDELLRKPYLHRELVLGWPAILEDLIQGSNSLLIVFEGADKIPPGYFLSGLSQYFGQLRINRQRLINLQMPADNRRPQAGVNQAVETQAGFLRQRLNRPFSGGIGFNCNPAVRGINQP